MYKILWSKVLSAGPVSMTVEVCTRLLGLGLRVCSWKNSTWNVALTINLGPVVAEIMICPGRWLINDDFTRSEG